MPENTLSRAPARTRGPLAGWLAVWLAGWLVGLTPRNPPDTFQIARVKVDSVQPGA